MTKYLPNNKTDFSGKWNLLRLTLSFVCSTPSNA